ncbi:MAG: LON peptidase substrate-binding domain-containing protein, partial [Nitrospirae bacterium]|nr:LON peptidase substrate-binding domain-containing protein [Nitrospirota bacterium]
MILPLFVGREMSIKAIEDALQGNRMILLVAQRDLNIENPEPKDIYAIGTVGMIMRMLKLPDGRIKILVQGLSKVRIREFYQQTPYFLVGIEKIAEPKIEEVTLEAEALLRSVKEQLERLIALGKVILPDIMVVVENVEDPGRLA